MILSSRWGLRIADFYYDEEAHTHGVDVARYIQWSRPIPGVLCAPFHTIIIDLSQDEDTLFAKMQRETRYRIRRAEADDLTYNHYDGANRDAVKEFCKFYNQFALTVELPPVNHSRLYRLAGHGFLDLSTVRQKNGESLVWHVYDRNGSRARGLHSAVLHRASSDAAYRGLVGRANRVHNWKDMLRFKAAGVSIFDLGGWYAGDTDPQKLRINRFKEEFGGCVVVNYNGIQALSAPGWFAIWSQRLVKKQLV